MTDDNHKDYSSVGHSRRRQQTSRERNRGATGASPDSSFRKEEREPRCLASETLDIPTQRISHSAERSLNHDKSRSRETASPSSSCSPKSHVVQPQLPKDLKSAVHDRIHGNTTVEKTKRATKGRSPPPVTRSQVPVRDTALSSLPSREENSSVGAKPPANIHCSTTSHALSRSRDGRSHSPTDVPQTQEARKTLTPEPWEKWHSDYTLPLANETNPTIASTRRGVVRHAFGARQGGPSNLRSTNSRWLSEGSYPGQKLEQRPPKPYFWRESPQRQRAPLERGRTYLTPPTTSRDWMDQPCPFSKKDSVFWDNLRLKKRVFLFGFVVVLGLLLTIAWFFLRDKEHAASEKAQLCLTDDCREYALYLNFRRNFSVDPCNDFYTHVCSSWKPPYGYGQIASTALAEIMIKWIRSFAEFLNHAASTNDVAKKPQALFEACVADRSADLSDVRRFRGFLSELNLPWPEQPPEVPSALGVLIDLALNWHDTFWLNLRVDVGNDSQKEKRRTKSSEDEAFVEDRYYLETIGELFAQYDDEILLRQMSWEFVQTHIVVLDNAPLELTLWGKAHAAPYITLYCAMYVEDVYRPLLAYLYSTSRLTYRDRLLVNAGLESVARQVTTKVNTSWLRESSKATALQKYKAMSFRLWPPDLPQEEVERFYRCFPNSGRSFVQIWIEGHKCMRRVPATPFHESSRGMHSVVSSHSVIYDYLSNSIDVAFTTFSHPVYFSYGTRAMFYGGVGFLFASQIMKAQDPTGLYITANGSVVDGSWMAPYDSDEFQNRVRCLGNGTEDYLRLPRCGTGSGVLSICRR
ncbi:hypothetical protein MTO96_034345 [Rhipicephalus appendiculatus]